jgi:alpha-1,3-mannosyltransferase
MALFVIECCLVSVIILEIAYTEIDWIAYMQEVEGWLGGELDYRKLSGDTGPLVYPAGFVYIFSVFRWMTGGGGRGLEALRIAQWIFMIVYLGTLILVLSVYKRARFSPTWALLLLCMSKRIHSLYVLRLFNDCIAMMVAYAFVLQSQSRRWKMASSLFSLALSVKMNVLLFLPGFLFLLARNLGPIKAFLHLGWIVLIQAVLGAPFLLHDTEAYIGRAFEFTRVFFHNWTVNLKFLPEDVFVSKPLAFVLLSGHLVTLVLLAHFVWCARDGGLMHVIQTTIGLKGRKSWTHQVNSGQYVDSSKTIAFVLLSSNFVGIVFARTLHYQFYTWYFHALPLLLWSGRLPLWVRLSCMACIEYAFNVGDADGAGSAFSSLLLQAAHFTCLIGLFRSPLEK